MNRQLQISIVLTLILLSVSAGPVSGADRWDNPFATTAAEVSSADSILTLPETLRLVANHNPLLASLDSRREVARGGVIQAGVRPNPEIEAEVEEFGWDSPGFDESAMGISLSQEFELFGQRGARRKVAEAEYRTIEFASRVAAFDLHLETQTRYYALAHAQEWSGLADTSISLAEDIVATIQDRIDKGAALESELLLAQLELQRAKLDGASAKLEIETARIELASLWAGEPSGLAVTAPSEPEIEPVLALITESMADSSRELVAMDRHQERLAAELRLAAVEAKPNLTLSGGLKRAAADGSNSFVFGLALPLPFRNQNRGTLHSVDAEMRQLDFERRKVRLESAAAVATGVARLRQLDYRHATIDDELLPTASAAYQTTQALYQAGRLPYTNLLEANRALVDLRFEHNDVLLAFREQVIALERLGGVILQVDEDSNND